MDGPEWVEEKIREINQFYFDVYNRMYDLIKGEEGSTVDVYRIMEVVERF